MKPKLIIKEVLWDANGTIRYKPYLKFPKWFGLSSNIYGICSEKNRREYTNLMDAYGEYSSDHFDSEVEAIEGVKQFLLWRIEEWNSKQKYISMEKKLKQIEIEIPLDTLINEIEKIIL